MDSEKLALVQSIQFPANALWLKDFYISKINKELVHREKAHGVVKMQMNEEQNLKLMMQVSSDNSYGVSPIRVQNNLFDYDNGDQLRAPNPN